MNKDKLLDEIFKLKYGNLKMMDNFKDIGNFLENNINDVKDVCLYHTGGGIWLYYILIDNKIYSIGDELFDGENDCIIYHGFDSIDKYLDFEDDMQNQGKDLCYDDVRQDRINIRKENFYKRIPYNLTGS